MLNELPVKVSKEKISEFCKKWKVKEFALFGSVKTSFFASFLQPFLSSFLRRTWLRLCCDMIYKMKPYVGAR